MNQDPENVGKPLIGARFADESPEESTIGDSLEIGSVKPRRALVEDDAPVLTEIDEDFPVMKLS